MKKVIFVFLVFIFSLELYSQNLWQNPFVLSSTEHVDMLDIEKYNGENYLLYVQEDEYCRANICVNKISNTGQFLWNEPIIVSEVDKISDLAKIVISSDNNFIVVWNESNNNVDVKLNALKISPTGQLIWPEKKIIYYTNIENKCLNVIPSNDGGIIASWYDSIALSQKIQVLSNMGMNLYDTEGLSIPQSEEAEFLKMSLSGNDLLLLISYPLDNNIKLSRINLQDSSSTINSSVVYNSSNSGISNLKVLSNNQILMSISNYEFSILQLLANNGSVLWSKRYDFEDILSIEPIEQDKFLILTGQFEQGLEIRKFNISGNQTDSLHILDYYNINTFREYATVKYGSNVVFSLEYKIHDINNYQNCSYSVYNLKYNYITNQAEGNALDNSENHFAISDNERVYLYTASDSICTSFIRRDSFSICNYLFNSINNSNLEYTFNDDLCIIEDASSSISRFESASINDKAYFLSSNDKIRLYSLDENQEFNNIRDYSELRNDYSLSLQRTNMNSLLISTSGYYSYENELDIYYYYFGAWVYNDQNSFIDTMTVDFSIYQGYGYGKAVIGDANQGFWIASKEYTNIFLHKNENNNFIGGNTGVDTGLANWPLSINNGYLLSRWYSEPNEFLVLHKFNPNGYLSPEWSIDGVCIKSNNYTENRKDIKIAGSYLTIEGLLVYWTEYNYNEQSDKVYVKLLNSSNGSTIWSSDSEIVNGKDVQFIFENNRFYISYKDIQTNKLKANCCILAGNQLIQEWTRTVVDRDVIEYNVKYINNRLVYAYSIEENGQNRLYMDVVSYLGNPDQFINGYLINSFEMECANPRLADIGQNRVMLSYLGYRDPKFKNHYASLIDLNQFVEKDDQTVSVKPLKVYQNYPNPFSPTTNIEFEIEKNSPVEITVYNIKGQKIRTLCFKNYEKGRHSIKWDGKDDWRKSVSSGIYFARVKNAEKSKTIKMLMVK